MDESRALQRAGWAGAASVVLLVVGVALCASAGVHNLAPARAAERLRAAPSPDGGRVPSRSEPPWTNHDPVQSATLPPSPADPVPALRSARVHTLRPPR
jgi:hypothetical protein